jgi:hypothetical protein
LPQLAQLVVVTPLDAFYVLVSKRLQNRIGWGIDNKQRAHERFWP